VLDTQKCEKLGYAMHQIVDIKDVLNIFSASPFKAQSEEKKEMALPCLSRQADTQTWPAGQVPKVG